MSSTLCFGTMVDGESMTARALILGRLATMLCVGAVVSVLGGCAGLGLGERDQAPRATASAAEPAEDTNPFSAITNIFKKRDEPAPQPSAAPPQTSAAAPPPEDNGVFSGITRFFSKKDEQAKEDIPAGRLFNEGLVLLNQDRFRAASLRFEEVDRAHPYSEWAKKSLLLIAYAQYRSGEYDNAAGAADRYLALHPGSEDAPYAKFLLGDSYYRQIPDVARDQGGSERALQALRELVQRYPGTEYARAAEQRMLVARDQLGGREMEIGRFYLKQKSYGAAAGRFKSVVQQFQTTRHIEEALYRLVECYLALGIVDEAQAAASVLGHNYPESEWYRDAFGLLSKDGLAPQDKTDSWITRALKSITG